MNVPTFSRFDILLRLRRPHEPSSRPPGRPSPGEVEAGGHGSGRSKRKGPPRVEKRASKRGEHSESQSCDDTILGISHLLLHTVHTLRWCARTLSWRQTNYLKLVWKYAFYNRGTQLVALFGQPLYFIFMVFLP